jgi:hypothetical protein
MYHVGEQHLSPVGFGEGKDACSRILECFVCGSQNDKVGPWTAKVWLIKGALGRQSLVEGNECAEVWVILEGVEDSLVLLFARGPLRDEEERGRAQHNGQGDALMSSERFEVEFKCRILAFSGRQK